MSNSENTVTAPPTKIAGGKSGLDIMSLCPVTNSRTEARKTFCCNKVNTTYA
jgi:hypothetical protein